MRKPPFFQKELKKMKIVEAITQVDALKPNTYTKEDMIGWLSTLDTKIKTQIIDAHEGGENIAFSGYDSSTDLETQMLVSAPFDGMYLRWLEAMIDYHNSDDSRYNNAIILFNNDYESFKRFYTRTHMPISKGNGFQF
jgi:hypothetical protein